LVTIPKKIRKQLNIKRGDKIYWILSSRTESELVIIHKPLDSLAGKYSKKGLTYKDLEGKADEIIKDKVKEESPQ
jgi:bifunctional DNA-binding transcriptional regulator/antitoxin component of YhaV-PrlF toxin-antitoxin module